MIREMAVKYLSSYLVQGDLNNVNSNEKYKISCNIVFYKRHDLLNGILTSLKYQTVKNFEVIIVEDKGKTVETGRFLKKFPELSVKHVSPSDNYGKMGYMRNYGLQFSEGEIILFLDDDTVITDESFLEKVSQLFDSDNELMAIIPKGNSSYSIIQNRYEYHDPYFFTNRCMAYRKTVLSKLKGFDNNFIGQEDVEFAIRFLSKNFKYTKSAELKYFHPPLIVKNISKPMSVGYSFAKSKHNFFIKMLFFLNGSRWIFLYLFPTQTNIQKAKFGFGYMLGFLKGITAKNRDLSYS